MKTLAIAVLLLLLPTASMANFYDGYKLKEMIDNKTGQELTAVGYVVGVSDAYDGEYFCIPQRAKVGQLHAVVKKSLEDNPQDWHMAAFLLVVVALKQSFPCKK